MASGSVQAQIVPDGTLGAERSRVTPINPNTERIDGGAIRGTNLFHSFQEFSIGEGRGAYFANPVGVENILSRVTGSNPSNILGTLGVLGNANLYLLNPNGIFFGPNARLDIRGSFTASTADSIVFSDRSLYSARDTQTRPLLTVAVPIGLQYGAQKAGAISNAGNLVVGQGQKLTLLGGTVTSTGQLTTPGGTVQVLGNQVALLDNAQIDVSSATGGGTVLVGGDFQGKGEVPNATQTFVGPGVTINADARTDGNGGRVIIWADDTTRFYGNISARGGANFGNGGFVEVSGKKNLVYRGNTTTSATNGQFGTLLLDPENITISTTVGDGQVVCSQQNCQVAGEGSYTISTTTLETLPGSVEVILEATNNITINQLGNFDVAGTYTPGALNFQAYTPDPLNPQLRPGAIEFRAGGTISMDSRDTISASGRAVKITGSSIELGQINTVSIVTVGGDISLEATTGNITLGAIDNTATGLLGGGINGANVTIKSLRGNISITDIEAKSITIDTFGKLFVARRLNARSDILVSADSITIGKSRRPSSVEVGENISTRNLVANGRGGNIYIETSGLLTVKGAATRNPGSPIDPSTPVGDGFSIGSEASSNGGNIYIMADGGIETRGGVVSNSRFSGSGGDITLKSSNGAIKNNAGTADSSSVVGNAGSITFDAGKDIHITGIINASSVFPISTPPFEVPIGDGGNVTLNAASDLVPNSIKSIGQRGGQIILNSGSILSLSNNDIASISTGSSIGGNISLSAPSISSTNARVATITTGNGQAGDVIVNATNSVSITDTFLGSLTFGTEKGGNVDVNVGQISIINTPVKITGGGLFEQFVRNLPDGSGLYTTTGGSGNSGSITVNTRQLTVQNNEPGLQGLAGITTATLPSSSGSAGAITINAPNFVEIIGNQPNAFKPAPSSRDIAFQVQKLPTGITSATEGFGDAGQITINTGQLKIQDGAAITSGVSSLGKGSGNSITVNASSVELRGGAALATATLGEGDGGNLSINASRQVNLVDGGMIAVDTLTAGKAGNLEINTGELNLTNFSRVGAATYTTGQGGNIVLNVAGDINLRNNSEITSEAFNTANGGNITIQAGGFIFSPSLADNNDIVATAQQGQGGQVFARATGIFTFRAFNGVRTSDSDFTAAALSGQNGNVTPRTRNPQPPPPIQPVVRQIPQVCPQGVTSRQAGRSEFMNTGRGGLPPNPGEALESNTVQVPWVTLDSEEQKTPSATTSKSFDSATPEVIEEAEGWVRLPNGKVRLTSQNSTLPSNPCVLRSSQQ
jgi:filamentous hemagglutinin family protein